MSKGRFNIKRERLTIFDVDTVLKADALELIKKVREMHPNYDVFKRSDKSFYNEFCVHKFCYILHILRKKTKDAGMQYPLSSFINFLYSIFGPISRIFIK